MRYQLSVASNALPIGLPPALEVSKNDVFELSIYKKIDPTLAGKLHGEGTRQGPTGWPSVSLTAMITPAKGRDRQKKSASNSLYLFREYLRTL